MGTQGSGVEISEGGELLEADQIEDIGGESFGGISDGGKDYGISLEQVEGDKHRQIRRVTKRAEGYGTHSPDNRTGKA